MTEEQLPGTEENQEDKMSPALNIIAFLIPLIGGIIYFSIKDSSPNKAKSIGRATLIGMAFGFVYFLLKMASTQGRSF
jgi:hypothetical protein